MGVFRLKRSYKRGDVKGDLHKGKLYKMEIVQMGHCVNEVVQATPLLKDHFDFFFFSLEYI